MFKRVSAMVSSTCSITPKQQMLFVSKTNRTLPAVFTMAIILIVTTAEATVATKHVDMCTLSSVTSERFDLTKGLESTDICRCQLTRVKRNVGFWIALNNFTCPEDVCSWRFQIIADGCIKDQYCCSSRWEGQEITYFPYSEHISTIYLQISQLASPSINIGKFSVSVMVEEKNHLSENGAQLTCGIAADLSHDYDFARCGRMPDLNYEPESSSVPPKKRAADDMVDLCTVKQITQNPVTFAMTGEAQEGAKICSARLSSVPGTNIFKYTLSKFTCSKPCSFRLMIIVGKCIKHYFCCGEKWEEVTRIIENVEGDSSIRVLKFGNQPETLEFTLRLLVGDKNGNFPLLHTLSGNKDSVGRIESCNKENCLQLSRGIQSCTPKPDNKPLNVSNATTQDEVKPYKSLNIAMSVMMAGFLVGGTAAMPMAKYTNYMVGFDGHGPVANGLAAHIMPYATANAGSLFSYLYNTMMAAAQHGFCVFHIIIIVVIGGFYGAATAAFWAVPILYFFW